jgi:hypothetical protein
VAADEWTVEARAAATWKVAATMVSEAVAWRLLTAAG